MESKSPESGFDELMRLHQQTTQMGQDITDREQQNAEQRQKVQGALQGLKDISISVALEQLKPIATPEIIEEVQSLTQKQGTGDLRRLITDLVDDLERCVSRVSASNQDIAPIERSIRTLAILIGLFFSLQ